MDRYETHAHTKERALQTLRQFGFVNIDDSQLTYARVSRPVSPMSTDFEKEQKGSK